MRTRAMLAGLASGVIVREWLPAGTASDVVGAVMHGAMVFVLFSALYLSAVVLLHGGTAPLRQVADPGLEPGVRAYEAQSDTCPSAILFPCLRCGL